MSKHPRYDADRTKAIRWIIDSLGGGSRTASLMGIKQQTVNNWLVRGVIPATVIPTLLGVWAEQVEADTLYDAPRPLIRVADITSSITRDVIQRPRYDDGGITRSKIKAPVLERKQYQPKKKPVSPITNAILTLDPPAGDLVDSLDIPYSDKHPDGPALKLSVNGSMMYIRKEQPDFSVEWQDTPTGLLVWRTK